MLRERRVRLVRILLVVLVILILIAGIYIGYKSYTKWRGERNLYIFQQGATYGYNQAVLQIINVSDSCQSFPVYAGNETRELVSVTCFK